MNLIQFDRQNGYMWLWRFLITWRDGEIFVGYYYDYEHCEHYWNYKR